MPDPAPQEKANAPAMPQMLRDLTGRLQHMDAETILLLALLWMLWQEKANAASFNFMFITAKQNWEDERERIATGELDYERMLTREIERLEKNIKELNEMDKKY